MNDVEDQLRDAFQAATETVRQESIRPRVLPAMPDRIRSTRRSSGMFIPLAAAAAVVVTIGAAVAVPRLVAQPSGAVPSPTASPGFSATPPPFLLVNQINKLVVRSATTGRTLGMVGMRVEDEAWLAVAATGDPRKFVVAAQHEGGARRTCPDDEAYALLYTLTLSASGAPAGLKPLSVPKIPGRLGGIDGHGPYIAASGDGSTVAYTTSTCDDRYQNPKSLMTIGVIRNGAVRTWTVSWFAEPASLSLSADGSKLGYVDLAQLSRSSPLGSAWVLPTNAAPGDATSRGHKVFSNVTHGFQAMSEVLSPDGATMYILTAAGGNGGSMTDRLYAYSTATGAQLRTLHTWEHIESWPPSVTAGGDQALILDIHSNNQVDEVSLVTGAERTFRQIPADPKYAVFNVAW